MGSKYQHWEARSASQPQSLDDLRQVILGNREFEAVDRLDYGDHGLLPVIDRIVAAIRTGERIALYADYDVDGTMSCVSWIWFLQAIGYTNFVPYIPCRFNEGYGVNLGAVKHLVEVEKASVILTMDTGITANEEAAWCRERDATFICTDHHTIQPAKMPDCLILNPKQHPDPAYQELCGCGITFVLLRKLAAHFPQLAQNHPVWTDLLALVGMATICDVVPLNGVNHTLARSGVRALMRSQRPVLRRLREAAAVTEDGDEKDVGFRLGPRINAVGRLEHAGLVVKAFLEDDPEPLVAHMGTCNERRKAIQVGIVSEARILASEAAQRGEPVLFLGGDWHPGVVGIAASKIAEEFWRPVWLYQRGADGTCKGSARTIPGFNVTAAMASCGELFRKFGGHAAAGGFTFDVANEQAIRAALIDYASDIRLSQPAMWESRLGFDCQIPAGLLSLEVADLLDDLKPFGHGFEEPRFVIEAPVEEIRYFYDKATGEPKHTAVMVRVDGARGRTREKILFFNQVIQSIKPGVQRRFVVSCSRNIWRGTASLSLMGLDFAEETAFS
ncbi:MAG: hypothetical protein RIQ81_1359 [Pseudomonadota bacterium]